MRPIELSNTSSTEARLTGFLSAEPLKITSCMCSPRSCLADDSPSTQRTASITFDFPHPFGPTTPTSWPGTAMEVGSTKDLKPDSLTDVSLKAGSLLVTRPARWDRQRGGGVSLCFYVPRPPGRFSRMGILPEPIPNGPQHEGARDLPESQAGARLRDPHGDPGIHLPL